jgi:uncharacterized protein
MNVSLSPELERFVREKVASGPYSDASEVIAEALQRFVQIEQMDPGSAVPTKDEIRKKLIGLEKEIRERGIDSVALFGSTARGDMSADSDIDLLVDLNPQSRFSLFDLVNLKLFLEEQLGREVDVVLREALAPAIRENVSQDEERVF